MAEIAETERTRVVPHTRDCNSHWDGECSCAPQTRAELQTLIDYLIGSRKRWQQEAEDQSAQVGTLQARVAELEQQERDRDEALAGRQPSPEERN